MVRLFRKIARPWAVVFALITIGNTLIPTVSWALTSGPTAPEYTGFTSINSTQNVDLFTGNFNYNIPLIGVEDMTSGQTYPISVSYNAGIKTNQESSWVGLGFDLNVGAINRSISGVPDDYFRANYSIKDTWEGGNQYREGFGLPITGLGLWFETNWSTHAPTKTLDVAMSLGPFSVDTRNGSVGISAFVPLWSGDKNKNATDDSKEVGKSRFPDLYKNFQIRFEIGENEAGNVGITSTMFTQSSYNPHNDKFGNISSQTVDYVNLLFYEYKKTRYWMDETDNAFATGTLNGYNLQYPLNEKDSFDKYISGEIITNPALDGNPRVIRNNNEFMVGPSFPAYDNYIVSSEGLSGSIQPLILENASLFDRKKENISTNSGAKYNLSYKIHKPYSKRPGFRFMGDFANSFTADYVANLQRAVGSPDVFGLNFCPNNQCNLGYVPVLSDDRGFDSDNLQIAGSNHIEYFGIENTNSNPRFIKHVRGFPVATFAEKNLSKQIAGFSITKPDGLTYHYSLPVYAYDETKIFRKYDTQNKKTERTIKYSQPYAYTWLLTAITGPDFVDRNNNQIPDEADFGQWTNFVYGKWTDAYGYRSPSEGQLKEIDGSEVYEYGKKQLYYLDAVYTRTNTCLFIKGGRDDGKGVTSLEQGGFSTSASSALPTSSLRLDKIVYINNSDLKSYAGALPGALDVLSAGSPVPNIVSLESYGVWKDVLKPKFLRAIEFEQDY
ncbi:MAG: hypothetical protein ACKO96_00300, partial [Flammeovirgaceae bacterium]